MKEDRVVIEGTVEIQEEQDNSGKVLQINNNVPGWVTW